MKSVARDTWYLNRKLVSVGVWSFLRQPVVDRHQSFSSNTLIFPTLHLNCPNDYSARSSANTSLIDLKTIKQPTWCPHVHIFQFKINLLINGNFEIATSVLFLFDFFCISCNLRGEDEKVQKFTARQNAQKNFSWWLAIERLFLAIETFSFIRDMLNLGYAFVLLLWGRLQIGSLLVSRDADCFQGKGHKKGRKRGRYHEESNSMGTWSLVLFTKTCRAWRTSSNEPRRAIKIMRFPF